MKTYPAVVVGAGINGLSAAYSLALRGVQVVVLDQFPAGHDRGSSHGFSRITRSTYSSSKYVELIQVAHSEDWPRLNAEAGENLLTPCPGCFFGPGLNPYEASLRAVPEVLPQIDVLAVPEARRRFPHFRFPDSQRVIWDRTCAVVAASRAMETLRAAIVRRGGEIREECAVESLDLNGQPVGLNTNRGVLSAERVVVAAGSWCAGLVPELASRLRVAHQDVGYFQFAEASPVAPGQFPVWLYAGADGLAGNESFYGLPEFGRPGIKVARHRTGSQEGGGSRELSQEARADLDDFVGRQFAYPADLCGYEPCIYTNTANEDFVIDYHPADKRVVLLSACSGHGFKFGPLSGRLAADLLLDEKSGVDAFERHRAAFSIKCLPRW